MWAQASKLRTVPALGAPANCATRAAWPPQAQHAVVAARGRGRLCSGPDQAEGVQARTAAYACMAGLPKWSEPRSRAGSGARLRLPGVPVQERERVRRARAQPQRQLLRLEAVHGHAQRRVHRRRRRRGLRAPEKLSVHADYGMSSPFFF